MIGRPAARVVAICNAWRNALLQPAPVAAMVEEPIPRKGTHPPGICPQMLFRSKLARSVRTICRFVMHRLVAFGPSPLP